MAKVTQAELNRYFDWRREMNRKHRTMTWGEWVAWCRGGDEISHPSSANALAGGITILLNTPPVIGKVDGWTDFEWSDSTASR